MKDKVPSAAPPGSQPPGHGPEQRHGARHHDAPQAAVHPRHEAGPRHLPWGWPGEGQGCLLRI